MILSTEKHMEKFFDTIGKTSIKKLYVASPFISVTGVNLIKNWIKNRKNTEVNILTNFSDFYTMFSQNNPVSPVINLRMSLNERVQVKSLSNLHAKLFMADNKSALAGSSNLTMGGSYTNLELNWIFNNKNKKGKEQLILLTQWYEDAWHLGSICTDQEMSEIEERWKENKKKFKNVFSSIIPEPWLAGNHWLKVKEITGTKKMSQNEVLAILTRQDKDQGITPEFDEDNSPKNAYSKLAFLKHTGMVRVENGMVIPLRKISKKQEMVEILYAHLPFFSAVVDAIMENPRGLTYDELKNKLLIKTDTEVTALKGAVNWLDDLELVERKTGGKHKFFPARDLKKFQIN